LLLLLLFYTSGDVRTGRRQKENIGCYFTIGGGGTASAAALAAPANGGANAAAVG